MDADAVQSSYFDYLQYERRYSSYTVTAYKNDLKQFFAYCVGHGYDPFHIEFRMIRQWIVALMDDKYTAKSVNRKITALRSFYKYLFRNKWISVNPMEKSSLLKVKKSLPVVVSAEKMRTLLAKDISELSFAELRDFLIVETLYYTGMRLSELIRLNDEDVDLKGKKIRVNGKRLKQRIIPIVGGFCSRLERYRVLRDEMFPDKICNAFFVLDSGKFLYPEKVYRVVTSLLYNVTLQSKRSPHVLRHSFATHLLQNNADLLAIKELLGHAGLAATQVYTHNTLQTIKSVYNHAHPRA